MSDSMLSTAQVAKLLGVTGTYVRDHAKELRGVDLGTRHKSCLRFRREDVDRFLQARML